MKLLIVLCIVVAVVSGSPLPPGEISYPSNNVQVLKFDNDNIGLGNYRFAYEQSDGQKQEQQGQIINEGREDESIAVKGSFSWVAPNGVVYRISYIADANGYQPEVEEAPGSGVPAHIASLIG